MSINLSYIKPRNSLNVACVKSDLCNAIILRVQSIEGYSELKFDNELLIFICNCIENTVDSKKFDKKTLVLEILGKLFELTEQESGVISKSVDFLCNNSLVTKVPSIQKYSSIISSYMRSKF